MTSRRIGLASHLVDGTKVRTACGIRALIREILCNFVDRVLRIGCHTIHELTLSDTKKAKSFGQGTQAKHFLRFS